MIAFLRRRHARLRDLPLATVHDSIARTHRDDSASDADPRSDIVSTGARECRLIVVASHPIQYFTPIYRQLAEVPGLNLEVLFCRDFGIAPRYDRGFGQTIRWDTDQLSGYSYRFLRNISPLTTTSSPMHAINPGAFSKVLAGCDAVWVNGFAYPTNWFAAAAAKLRGVRLLYASDMRLDQRRPRHPAQGLRDRMIRGWIRHTDALLYIGEANREAYVAYGARDEQLHYAPFSVDVERLSAARLGADEKRAARKKWGLDPDALVVLAAGKLTERKHPEALLEVCEAARGQVRLQAVFAGSGPLEASLREECARRGLSNVAFLGFVNQASLPEVYALADIFIMPSEREPWGLALNEAMAAGLAPVASDEVGAVRDLIRPGETGYVFRSGNWDELSQHVLRLARDGALRAQIQSRAHERSCQFSYAASAAGIVSALRALGVYEPTPAKIERAPAYSSAASP
jgi:glycosyltransferase involved in cell wall biosynthesis